MKKTIAFLVAGLCAGTLLAGMNNVVIQFSTVGPDTYADGATVMDGETYALVWTPTGATFGGINANGEALGENDKGEKCMVVLKAPFAKGGHCPNIKFQVDEGYAAEHYKGGTWGVYLLDTRKFVTEPVKIVVDGKEIEQTQVKTGPDGKKVSTGVGGTVSGYGAVLSDVKPSLSPAGAKGGIVQSVPAGIQPPTIKDFKVINGMAYLFLQNTSPAVSYGVAAGQAPGSLAPVPQQQPVMGGGSETIIVTPATGASGFYQGIVR